MKLPIHAALAALVVCLPYQTALATETGTSENLFYLNKLDQNWFLVARANAVSRDGFSDFFFGYADVNLRYALSSDWSVEAGYRQAYLKLATGWREEYRPMFGAIWKTNSEVLRFTNRHRLELRYFEGNAANRVRYRNESVWTFHDKISRFELTPFIEEEFFFDATSNQLNLNWLTFGISKFFSKNMKWKLGYRLQSRRVPGDWENRHVLVTGLSIFSF